MLCFKVTPYKILFCLANPTNDIWAHVLDDIRGLLQMEQSQPQKLIWEVCFIYVRTNLILWIGLVCGHTVSMTTVGCR